MCTVFLPHPPPGVHQTGASPAIWPDKSYLGPIEVVYIGEPEGPYLGGYTNTIFRCNEHTNINGLRIPMQSVMKTYIPYRKPLQTETNLLLIAQYNLFVTNVEYRISKRTDYRPKLEKLALIGDFRFKDNSKHKIDVLNYFSLKWLDEDEVKKTPEYGKMLKLKQLGERQASVRYLMVAIFACLLLLPLITWGFRLFGVNSAKHNK
jgi:hypothetical protein